MKQYVKPELIIELFDEKVVCDLAHGSGEDDVDWFDPELDDM